MFTGIVSSQGRVVSRRDLPGGVTLTIAPETPLGELPLGASVACAGVCLTVTEATATGFTVEASRETLAKTTLGGWGMGERVNLERALKVGDELGGHIVLGHVDGVGRVRAFAADGNSHRLAVEAPPGLLPFIAAKGSIALDGVSLTVNQVDADAFGVMVIPYTLAHTSLGRLAVGAPVNLEVDVLARYAARLLERSPADMAAARPEDRKTA